MKLLYLLALAQLIGGPLVLLQVTLFCKLTVRESRDEGLVRAAGQVWKSSEFQNLLAKNLVEGTHQRKSTGSSPGDPKFKVDPAKQPWVPWMTDHLLISCGSVRVCIVDVARIWTPAWPQAPPGPPPRLG